MTTLFKNLIKPMYSIGKETLTIKFDINHTNKKTGFNESVVTYLNSIGKVCFDSGEKYGNFPLINLDGKSYLLEKRYLTNESFELSEIAILIEK
ncbi:hypothetical protein [uncultured Clostridium sp.]|uniref:hypothetical protein n=1 Tax=uncultured Clostridium sp. TaxID=59620 RepID=UPI002631376F|nr:hypothetical protein [uncultured Clostridium sp.]